MRCVSFKFPVRLLWHAESKITTSLVTYHYLSNKCCTTKFIHLRHSCGKNQLFRSGKSVLKEHVQTSGWYFSLEKRCHMLSCQRELALCLTIWQVCLNALCRVLTLGICYWQMHILSRRLGVVYVITTVMQHCWEMCHSYVLISLQLSDRERSLMCHYIKWYGYFLNQKTFTWLLSHKVTWFQFHHCDGFMVALIASLEFTLL